MKLVSLESARLMFLFPIEEARPFTGIPFRDFIDAAKAKYDFLDVPDLNRPVDELRNGPLFFREGRLEGDNFEAVVIQEVGLYRDGIIIKTHHTDSCEAVLNDVLAWATAHFKLREPISAPTKVAGSSVVVDFEKDISLLIGPYSRLAELLSDRLKEFRKIDQRVVAQRLAFGVDFSKLPPGTIAAEFVIERRLGVPYDQNRYFSDAPLPTDAHLQLLTDIEVLVPNSN